jgi:hypothetical protein
VLQRGQVVDAGLAVSAEHEDNGIGEAVQIVEETVFLGHRWRA